MLRERAHRAGGAPLVTFVDAGSGERTELSATSLENAAAKVANALREDLDPGAVVGLHLPTHWQRAVWCAGTWTAGLVTAPDAVAADLLVVSADRAPALTAAGHEVGVVSMHPFGLPVADDLPAGATDLTLAVRQQPDAYLFDAGTPASPAWQAGGTTLDQSAVLDRARTLATGWGLEPGGRLLVDDSVADEEAWLAALAVPLVSGGAVVLVRGDGSTVADQERVTCVATTRP